MSMSLGMSMSVYRKRHTGSVSSLLHTSARNFDAFLRCRWGANIDSALGGGGRGATIGDFALSSKLIIMLLAFAILFESGQAG